MYPFNNGTATVNRLPKAAPTSMTATPSSSLGKNLGNTVVQAVVLVAVIRIVDVLFEVAMSRFRKPKQDPGA